MIGPLLDRIIGLTSSPSSLKKPAPPATAMGRFVFQLGDTIATGITGTSASSAKSPVVKDITTMMIDRKVLITPSRKTDPGSELRRIIRLLATACQSTFLFGSGSARAAGYSTGKKIPRFVLGMTCKSGCTVFLAMYSSLRHGLAVKTAARVRQVSSRKELEKAFAIRVRVFVREQKVPEEIELDRDDERAAHFLAFSGENAVGTARVVMRGKSAKIGRMAILKSYRRRGVGKKLLKCAVA